MKEWHKERLHRCPLEFEKIGPDIYMQRQNIKEVVHEPEREMPAYTDYECDCRELSADETILVLSEREGKNRSDIDFLAIMQGIEL